MTSSSSPVRSAVLRGGAPNSRPARMNGDLGSSPFATSRFTDARLVDPVLEQVVADAAARAGAEARRAGHDEGYAAGLASAAAELAADRAALLEQHDQDRRQRTAQLARALSALDAATTALEQRLAPSAEQVERLALHAAVEIAEVLLGRELALAGDPALDAVRRALTLAPLDGDLLVRLHPADVEGMDDAIRAAAPGRAVQVVADPAVEPGGCVVDSGACHVDAQLGPALDRVRAALA